MQSIFRLFVVLACASGLVAPWTASAQSIGTADMTGRVVDQQGAVLPGVTLVLRSIESGLYRQGVTNANGVYNFTGVLPGMYQIEVELAGFKKYSRNDLKLEVGKTMGLDIAMELGTISEGVTVTAFEVPIVDLTSKTVGGFVETRELVDLPTASRSFTSYLQVLPGVVDGNIGGQDGTLNSFDGGNLNDATRGGNQVRIPIEAIQEFQLIVSQPDAQFGVNGGVINAVSKTGTNEVHGTALSLIRDSSLQQLTYFQKLRNQTNADSKRNQFAFSLGGPIVLNKMHYFGTYEHHVTRNARTPNILGRPDINVTKIFPSTTYSIFARMDHQLSANHTWSFRYLSEYLPSLNSADVIAAARTAEDHDQNWGGTLNSVFGTKVNAFRVSMTREDYLDSSVAFKAAGYRQERLLPTLAYNNFTDQQNAKGDAVGEHNYLINDTLTWSVPNFKGEHQVQAGFEFAWSRVNNNVQDNLNGTFRFSHNLAFNAADPRTWPDQFTIRVPIELNHLDIQDYYSAFVQDKWKIGQRFTATLGVRYEVEIFPIKHFDNPKFPDPNKYPVDKNNFAPRTGFAYALTDRTVVRGGYGMFFQRTEFGTVSAFARSATYANSFTFTSPANNRDPGPGAGQFPKDPFLATFPVVNRALVDQMFPVGAVQKNAGTIRWDDPSRTSPYTHQYLRGRRAAARTDDLRQRRLHAQGGAGPAGAGRPQPAAARQHVTDRPSEPAAHAGVHVGGGHVPQPGLAEHRPGGRVVQQALQQSLLPPGGLHVVGRLG